MMSDTTLEMRAKMLNLFFSGKKYEPLRDWIENSGFMQAPASTKYHGAHEGGLFDHSLRVAIALAELTRNNALKWGKKRSPMLVGISHDFCKFDRYTWDETEQKYEYNTAVTDDRHGERSVEIVSALVPDLTEEEALCIKYHMGFTLPKEEWAGYREAIKKYPNVLWTHHADMIAACVNEMK